MSNYQTLAGRLIYRLGNRTDLGPTSSASARVYEFLASGAQELAHRLKNLGIRVQRLEDRIDYAWPSGQEDQGYDTILTSGRLYAIMKAYDRTAKRELGFMAPPAFEDERLQAPVGEPKNWTVYERTLSLVPKPDANLTLRLLVYLDPAPIATVPQAHEFEPSYEQGLLLLAETEGWDALGNEEGANAAEARFERWITRKKAPAEHERSQRHSRGLRPAPAWTQDKDLGI